MANPDGAGQVYFNREQMQTVSRFTPGEIEILLREGRGLFELTMENPSRRELDYLRDHPRLREVLEKW